MRAAVARNPWQKSTAGHRPNKWTPRASKHEPSALLLVPAAGTKRHLLEHHDLGLVICCGEGNTAKPSAFICSRNVWVRSERVCRCRRWVAVSPWPSDLPEQVRQPDRSVSESAQPEVSAIYLTRGRPI